MQGTLNWGDWYLIGCFLLNIVITLVIMADLLFRDLGWVHERHLIRTDLEPEEDNTGAVTHSLFLSSHVFAKFGYDRVFFACILAVFLILHAYWLCLLRNGSLFRKWSELVDYEDDQLLKYKERVDARIEWYEKEDRSRSQLSMHRGAPQLTGAVMAQFKAAQAAGASPQAQRPPMQSAPQQRFVPSSTPNGTVRLGTRGAIDFRLGRLTTDSGDRGVQPLAHV